MNQEQDPAQDKKQESEKLCGTGRRAAGGASVSFDAVPGGIVAHADEPEQVEPDDIAPVEVSVIEAGTALRQEEFLRHPRQQHEPGKGVCPVKNAARNAAQSQQQRKCQYQQG